MKKTLQWAVLIVLVVALTVAVLLLNASPSKSPVEHAADVVRLMTELTRSDPYRSLMTSDTSIQALAQEIASGDYTSPKAVYLITPPKDMLGTLSSAADGESLTLGQMSEQAAKWINHRLLGAIFNQINASGGSTVLAASAMYTASKTFVAPELQEGRIYLYTFESGRPIAVTMTPGEDGAVSASGCYILNDQFATDSEKAIQAALEEMVQLKGCKVEQVLAD